MKSTQPRRRPTAGSDGASTRRALRAPFQRGREKMKLKTIAAAMLCATLPLGVQAQETEDLKIGALVTLSGAGAAWVQGMKNAAELAALEVNKAGGLEVGG